MCGNLHHACRGEQGRNELVDLLVLWWAFADNQKAPNAESIAFGFTLENKDFL